MKIPYASTSQFILPCQHVIENQLAELYEGNTLHVPLEPGGYDGRFRITTQPTNSVDFESNYEGSDPTRFPARIKAAATALFNSRCFGTFVIAHEDSGILIQKVDQLGTNNSSIIKSERSLLLFEDYSREEVHRIFSPQTRFTPQAGTWGLHGIVAIPNRPNDFVFFVTFGQEQGEHVFDEGITTEGVLTWQSQPKQTLDNPQILQFINHDELTSNIHLFLRAKKRMNYTYLGPLKYLTHDAYREKPVHFQWQILNSPIPSETCLRVGLNLQEGGDLENGESKELLVGLRLIDSPPRKETRAKNTSFFRTRKSPDYSSQDARNRDLGLAGELLVLEEERKFLIAQGRQDLAQNIRHTSVIEGDGAGYDILSFHLDGTDKFIEVKTTAGTASTSFFMSANEVEFSHQHPDNYYLYRVCNFDKDSNSGDVFIRRGDITNNFELTPSQFRVR